jgi:cytochrome c556
MRRIYALVPLLLAACVTPAATQDQPPLYVRHAMQAEVNPAIVAIWDVTNNAIGDDGALDASLITPASWDAIATAAGALATASDHMAAASDIRAAAPGNMATDEFEVPMAQVQTYLDADPQGFRDLSAAFATLSRRLESAARARDSAATAALVEQMDTQCSTCHTRYWYAEAQ